MHILENLISAFSVLRGSKLRTVLTLLGITIGIAGVIAMMSFGAGAEKLMMAEFENIGGPSMFGVYRPGYIRKNNRWQRNTSPHYLEMQDLYDILTDCPSVEVATVERSHFINFEVEGKHRQTYMRATTNEYQAVRRWKAEYGRFLADTDMDFWNKVCVIGAKVWKEQFKGQDPVGKEVSINNRRFTVIGIMESRGDGLERGRSDDNMIFVPITTAQTRFGGRNRVGAIMARAKSIDVVEQALKEVKTVISRNHGGDDTFFRTWNAKKGIESGKRMIFIIESVLVVIASVSLIVAGIGILNIMLVSVTERIPEIGLRKAVGAKSLDIRIQFLTESVLLCLIGSLLGITLGAVVGNGFAWIVGKFLDEMSWPAVITLKAVLISVGAGAAVGIFFGYYPASQAAKMTPIDAIRHT
ncbi:FtsX-like permease family protein [Candidatus Poribacteria bacterium]|nr:FtsX-like permease family protein [Candidatus Poribacteria bacterium]MYH81392.1 FtsX-like permease family protein [Candidatus Poribacteria bacterium]MYK95635.1 FtsX-like permease family protein [Candidatus Poribacteria bacterium]